MATVEVETGRFVKRFEFWNPATWSIPSLYWDTFSQEQRIHAICRQLGKVIAYADYVGVNVDDIAARLKAIEDGQLDDLIIQEIETWLASEGYAYIDGKIAEEIGTEFDDVYAKINRRQPVLSQAEVITIGDSWAAGVVDGMLSNYDADNGWAHMLHDFSGSAKTWHYYAQPSAGFAVKGGVNQRDFEDLLDLSIAAVSDKASIGYIIVGGGINDANAYNSGTITVTDLSNAIASFVNKAKNNYPNAKIVVFPMLFSGHSPVRDADVRIKREMVTYLNRRTGNIMVCDHCPEWLLGFKDYYGSETQGHHTTIDGMVRVAHYMQAFINGGDSHVSLYEYTRDTTETNIITFTNLEVKLANGMLDVRFTGTLNDTTLTTPLLTLNNDYFKGLLSHYPTQGKQGGAYLARCTDNHIYVASLMAGDAVAVGQQVYFAYTCPFAF